MSTWTRLLAGAAVRLSADTANQETCGGKH